MKSILWAAGAAGLLILTAQAQGERNSAQSVAPAAARQLDWSEWTSIAPAAPEAAAAAVPAEPEAEPQAPAPDVADAHWMAMTMWGEARGQGEEGMRAVGHVIDNRRRSGIHGAFVTDTVSEAFQFSCWNPADPNREAMLNVLALPQDNYDHRMWIAARRLAGEIMSGRSEDPTAGALFYHTTGVAPRWSRGIAPVARIGPHLFFRSLREG